MFTLLRKLPCVNDLTLSLYDMERKSPELRKQLRIDFAKALGSGQSGVLNKLELDYKHETPIDQRFMSADVRGTYDDSENDALSINLNRFLSRCCKPIKVSLGGPICIDEALFWPPISSANNDSWASLQELRIDMSSIRLDGG
jgi:hypothetical protein